MNPILIKGVVVLAALLLNYIIGPFAVRAAVRDYTELPQVTNRGLPQGGKLIGQFERLLILLFVLVGSVSGVGFLLTAKSVFRFGDIKEDATHKRAEYYLIGTLASFAFGLTVSYVAIWIISAL